MSLISGERGRAVLQDFENKNCRNWAFGMDRLVDLERDLGLESAANVLRYSYSPQVALPGCRDLASEAAESLLPVSLSGSKSQGGPFHW